METEHAQRCARWDACMRPRRCAPGSEGDFNRLGTGEPRLCHREIDGHPGHGVNEKVGNVGNAVLSSVEQASVLVGSCVQKYIRP